MKKDEDGPAEEAPRAGAERRSFIARAAAGAVGALLLLRGEARSAVAQVPKDLYYSENHVWVRPSSGLWVFGLTSYAAGQLGGVNCVDLTCKVGEAVAVGASFGTVSHIDTLDLLMPIAGTVEQKNLAAELDPKLLDRDPYGNAWLIKVRPRAGAPRLLMDAAGYGQYVGGRPALKVHERVPPGDSEAYVVTGACVGCKYTDCAAVCPANAFHELPDRVYINPRTCINCDACVTECPVEAIYSPHAVPEELTEWVKLNAEAWKYPVICYKKPALRQAGCNGPPDKP